MAASGNETEEWRLGIEPGVHGAPATPEEAAAPRNRSAARLERPLCVLTAEHVGWATYGVLALPPRIVTLAAPPLSTADPTHPPTHPPFLPPPPPPPPHPPSLPLRPASRPAP